MTFSIHRGDECAVDVVSAFAEHGIDPAGFVVACRTGDRLVDDWDGEIHPTREAGQRSLAQCRADGHLGYGLYALTEVRYA